mgnify:CR=1 FL=1
MKNVLLTGISKGLGLETARILLNKGYSVYGISRSESTELIMLKEQYPETLKTLKFDLSNAESVKTTIFDQFVPLTTPIHAYINNAAMAYDDIVTNANYDRLKASFDVNFFTPVIMTKYAIRNMIFNNIPGSIVHVSSISVHTGYKGLSMYAASKGALEAFSKNTAREWGSKKIRSNCLVSGFMETEMSSSLSDEQKDRIYKRTSLKEAVSIHSVAAMIEFLVSAAASSVTGQNIFVDNGTI